MKKLLKISLLAALFMALWTITSKAATIEYVVSQDNSITVTITCTGDIDDAAKTVFEEAGYTVNVSEKTATRTYDNARQVPKYKYFEFEDICVATPLEMTVGNSRTVEGSSTITNTTDSNIVEIQNGNKYVAKAVGTSTITINANNAEHPNEIYEQRITVVDESVDPEPSSDYTATYEGNSLVVSGLPTGGSYAYFADFSSSTPYENSTTIFSLIEGEGSYVSAETSNDLIQINQDIYAHIVDKADPLHPVKIADVKVTKPSFNNYNYFSSLSHSTKTHTQLLFDIPYDLNNEDMPRKIHYKIGSISDASILRLFKNGDASGFAKLMEYAENDSNPLYDEVKSPVYANGYAQDGEIIAGSKLTDNAFYYLYAVLEDEDGKYIPLKSVTLAQADVFPDQDYSWYLFFYGSRELNFDGVSDPTTPDSDKTPSVLPATGEKALVFALIGVTVAGVVIFRKKMRKF